MFYICWNRTMDFRDGVREKGEKTDKTIIGRGPTWQPPTKSQNMRGSAPGIQPPCEFNQ